jgi:hypothetical protein
MSWLPSSQPQTKTIWPGIGLGICSTAVIGRSGCRDADTISGQASGEKVEVKSLLTLFNYKSVLFTKTRATAKKISA